MKPTEGGFPPEEDEHVTSPPIPLVISSTSSNDSGSLAGKGIALTGVDSASVEMGKPGNQHSRDQVVPIPDHQTGRPPLPQNLEIKQQQQQRDDIPTPPVLGRDQSTGTAVSGLTENSVEQSPTRSGHNRKVSWDTGLLDTAVAVEGLPSPLVFSRSNSSDTNKFLSVADLHAVSPLEAEAETGILKAIEEREDDPSSVGRNIFQCIPESATDSFRVTQDAGSKTPSSVLSPTPTQTGHRRMPTRMTAGRGNKVNLETTLLDLTVAMRDMHERSEDTTVIPENDQLHDDQTIINDANVLFRRSTLQKEKGRRMLQKEKSNRNLMSRRRTSTMGGLTHVELNETDGSGVSWGETQDEVDVDLELGESDESSDKPSGSKGKRTFLRCMNRRLACGKTVEEDWATFSDFMRPRRPSIMLSLKSLLFAFILPTLAIACLLFYGFDNPDLGREGATISWLLLFLIRHSILYILAKTLQLLFIDFLALNTRWLVRVLGPFPSLCLVQSRGFPYIISTWAVLAIATLSGTSQFAKHWLFYQDAMPMFNENNPAGTITESRMNYSVLTCALLLGIVATLKRVVLGMYFGKRTYAHFGDDLAKVVRKILLVGEVAALAKDLELGVSVQHIQMRAAVLAFNVGAHDVKVKGSADCEEGSGFTSSGLSYSKIIDNARRDRYTGSLTQSQKNELMCLLEGWEEPEAEKKAKDDASISAILQFRQALTLTTNDFPFSMAFGLADTRENCIVSAQKVYKRLLLRQPEEEGEHVLDFDTIALLATTDDGGIDHEKMKEMIRLFRPERNGTLTMIDFVKSVDAVYKRLRLLSASIANAGQIDHAAERIFNCVFYTVIAIIIISILGFDPVAMFLSVSSIIVAFAFMIGNASAKYFEGILFVLVRRPFGIGDRIHVSPVDQDTNPNGSSTWYVENVDLFTTTVRFATTNEVATVSNGSLANTRVINAARSPKMLVYVYMKFGVDVPYQKVKLFRKTVEEFVKQRPRSWLSMSGFRATKVEHELGYIEYVMVLQHRERWQNVIPMLNAKAELSSFALEVAKKLDMPYRAPSLPVDLTMGNAIMTRMNDAVSAENNLEEMTKSVRTTPDMSDVAALFAAASVD